MPCPPAENVPEVVVVSTSQFAHAAPALYWIVYETTSVTPASGPHDTVNVLRFWYWLRPFTWDPGRIVSTVVQVSFAEERTSLFPARSSAVVANSYTPSDEAVNVN